jgi:hypothetical protein
MDYQPDGSPQQTGVTSSMELPAGSRKYSDRPPLGHVSSLSISTSMFHQLVSPGIQRVGGNAQCAMPRPFGSVCRELSLRLRRFRIEDQKHSLARPEENVSPSFLAYDIQSENISIEYLGPVEVIDVESGFEEVLNSRGTHSS